MGHALRLDDLFVYRSPALDAHHWILHGFGTRRSVDWPPPLPVATLRQVHSSISRIARHAGYAGEGDALVTDRPGLLLTVRTADCLPILLAATRRRAVAAIHAGWRGTLADVAGATVRRMCDEFGCEPRELLAVIGPGIGVCCYQVGPEVAVQFRTIFPEWPAWLAPGRIDLAEANRRQLVGAGLAESAVHVTGLCTRCSPADFHSFRRDRARGRMTSGIGVA